MSAIFTLFTEGGPLMWPLLVCSLLSLTIAIERSAFWRTRVKRRKSCRADLDSALDAARSGEVDSAAATLTAISDPAARVLQAGLVSLDATRAMEQQATTEMRACRRGLKTLDTVVTIAPMLGLLGTVTGVIRSFGFVGKSGGAPFDTSLVGGGIAEALITTAFGLAIAIVTVVPYNYFSSRLLAEAEDISALGTALEEALGHESTVGN